VLQAASPELRKGVATTEVMVNRPDDVYVERKERIEKVADRLFEGEEAVLHVMGDQIASEKRRKGVDTNLVLD
jgi:Flp pilus assembly CpaF family ATPase